MVRTHGKEEVRYFVFKGIPDTEAEVNDCDGNKKWFPALSIAVLRVRKDGVLDWQLDVASAVECSPRRQIILSTIENRESQPVPTATPAPEPTPGVTPTPKAPPAQVPVQVPRTSNSPALSEEFGSVAILSGGQLGREVFE
jgi:hypothetical protein